MQHKKVQREVKRKKVQHGKSATHKKVQHEKSATRKKCKTEKVQREINAT